MGYRCGAGRFVLVLRKLRAENRQQNGPQGLAAGDCNYRRLTAGSLIAAGLRHHIAGDRSVLEMELESCKLGREMELEREELAYSIWKFK